MNWYLEALKKYAVFSGRARRTEYWMFGLFYLIFRRVLEVLDVLRIKEQIVCRRNGYRTAAALQQLQLPPTLLQTLAPPPQ